MQRSPAASTTPHVRWFFFGSCENRLRRYKRSRSLRCITLGIVQCHVCENTTLLAIKQFRKIAFSKVHKNNDVTLKRYDRNWLLYLVILIKLLKLKRFVVAV